jgi:hypothetical protein
MITIESIYRNRKGKESRLRLYPLKALLSHRIGRNKSRSSPPTRRITVLAIGSLASSVIVVVLRKTPRVRLIGKWIISSQNMTTITTKIMEVNETLTTL